MFNTLKNLWIICVKLSKSWKQSKNIAKGVQPKTFFSSSLVVLRWSWVKKILKLNPSLCLNAQAAVTSSLRLSLSSIYRAAVVSSIYSANFPLNWNYANVEVPQKNPQYLFLQTIRGGVGGGGGGQRPFEAFPKIHPFWWSRASLCENIDICKDFSFFERKKTIEIEREENKSIGEFSVQTEKSSWCRLKAQCLIIFRFPQKAFLTQIFTSLPF